MRFSSPIAIISLSALAGITLAAPVQDFGKLVARSDASNPIYTVFPIVTSQYNVGTGAVSFDTGVGEVDKSTSDGGHDITSLLTFYIPSYTSGYTCELVFDSATTSHVSGTGGAQAFLSLAPATASTSSWPQGNQRDKQIGTLATVAGQRATWDVPASTRQFPCSEAVGRLYGGELVPTGDNDHISWSPYVDGPKIVVY